MKDIATRLDTPFVAALAMLACGHSEPFVTTDRDPFGPFSGTEPIRLTYADGYNILPAFSQDGSRLVYAFGEDSPVHDADVCLGVLPVGGGARLATVCPRVNDDADFRDGIASGALSSQGMLAFVQHSGRTPPNVSSLRGGLFLATFDSVADAREILPLKQRPSNGGEAWDNLLNLRWTAAHELIALAARTEYRGPNLARDTLHFGIDVVRLRTNHSPVEWTPVAPGLGASVMTMDESTGMIYLLVHYYPTDDELAIPIADTIFRVPIAGGQPEPVLGLPREGGLRFERLTDIAASNGRLLATRRWTGLSDLHSDLVEVSAQWQISPIATNLPGLWGRIAISPDGRTVIGESLDNGINLYQVPLQ